MSIKQHTVQQISVDVIEFDESNPNMMSPEQLEALGKSIEKFGYLVPVILGAQKNKRYSIIDGEHRVRAYIARGEREIPAYVIDVTRVEKKILRQVMNKLSGTHDPEKDVSEYSKINTAGKMEELSNFLARDGDELILEAEEGAGLQLEREELKMPQGHTNITLVFGQNEFDGINKRMNYLKKKWHIDDNTAFFIRLMEEVKA